MTAAYRYGSLGSHYLCLDQSALEFSSCVLWAQRAFVRHLLGVSDSALVKAVAILLARDLGLKNGSPACELAWKGQVARRVNGGVRIFDFRAGQVTKAFDPALAADRRRLEVEAVERAAACRFAPRLVGVGDEAAWYREELWPGMQVARAGQGLTTGTEHAFLGSELGALTAALAELALVHAPERVRSDEHLETIMADVSDWLRQARERDPEGADVVEGFIEGTIGRLGRRHELFLTFSHGDFSLVNVIANGRGWRVVDWEDGLQRAALADFHSLFTTELYYGREDAQLFVWAESSRENLLRALEHGHEELARSLRRSPERYRAWSHLERLRMLMSRGADERRIRVVRRSADIFERFDRLWPAGRGGSS